MPNLRPPPCCPDFVAHQGREHEYPRAKAILNIGKHPTFIGRGLYATSARNGGAMFFTVDGRDAAVARMNPRTNCLLVLCVMPEFRSFSGTFAMSLVAYLQVSFIRALERTVCFFRRCGFIPIGEPKIGKR